jgi:hypothetical protein
MSMFNLLSRLFHHRIAAFNTGDLISWQNASDNDTIDTVYV